MSLFRTSLLVGILFLFFAPLSARAVEPAYHVSTILPLPDTNGWDNLVFDESARRLYIAYGDTVLVLNGDTLETIVSLPAAKVHGVALALPLAEGFFSNGTSGTVTRFDPRNEQTIAAIATGVTNPDAIVFEPRTTKVFAFGHDHTAVIDPVRDTLIDTLTLPAKPEFALADGSGRVFVNLVETAEIGVIDAQKRTLTARWSLGEGCKEPSALALDAIHKHLFSACGSGVLVMVDSDYGQIEATVPASPKIDALIYDATRNRVFAADGGGTIAEFGPGPDGKFQGLGSFATLPGARTMALDEHGNRLFTVTADRTPDGPSRFAAGSAKLLVLTPIANGVVPSATERSE